MANLGLTLRSDVKLAVKLLSLHSLPTTTPLPEVGTLLTRRPHQRSGQWSTLVSNPARGHRVVDTLRMDLAFAFRLFRRNATFAVSVTVTLAVGIAAATAMFAVVQGVLLSPLPIRDQARVVVLRWRDRGSMRWCSAHSRRSRFFWRRWACMP